MASNVSPELSTVAIKTPIVTVFNVERTEILFRYQHTTDVVLNMTRNTQTITGTDNVIIKTIANAPDVKLSGNYKKQSIPAIEHTFSATLEETTEPFDVFEEFTVTPADVSGDEIKVTLNRKPANTTSPYLDFVTVGSVSSTPLTEVTTWTVGNEENEYMYDAVTQELSIWKTHVENINTAGVTLTAGFKAEVTNSVKMAVTSDAELPSGRVEVRGTAVLDCETGDYAVLLVLPNATLTSDASLEIGTVDNAIPFEYTAQDTSNCPGGSKDLAYVKYVGEDDYS